MRGKLRHRHRRHAGGRIIPAHAGQTSLPWRYEPFRSDHPRACGANPELRGSKIAVIGSSPRMRGKRCPLALAAIRMRIIPAHAGQTAGRRESYIPRADHPRACGANPQAAVRPQVFAGSSPRMRGKQPAERPRMVVESDHPRACGANSPILCENS